ncbi:MAG: hypothetical protein J6D27_02310 [Ruminiclostridium sp.]|nr:hypothetical protein [Ruminiclostridium sp.]
MKNYIKTLLFSLLILGSAVVFCACNSSDDDAFPLHNSVISNDNISDTPENSRYIFKRTVITKDDGEITNEYIEITDKRDNSKKKLPFEPQRENVSIYGLFPTEKYLYYGTQGHKSELLTIERLDLDSFSTETLYESTRTADKLLFGLAFSYNSMEIISATAYPSYILSDDNDVLFIDIDEGLFKILPDKNIKCLIADNIENGFAYDGKYFIYITNDGILKQYEIKSGKTEILTDKTVTPYTLKVTKEDITFESDKEKVTIKR